MLMSFVSTHLLQQDRQVAQACVTELRRETVLDLAEERSGSDPLPSRHPTRLGGFSAGLATAAVCGLPAREPGPAETGCGSTGSSWVDRFGSMASRPPT